MLRALRRWAGLLAMALPSTACFADGVFECQASAQCEGGQCFDGYCGFADGDCPSGFAYGAHAPGELAKTCVPPADDTTDATTTNASTITASTQSTDDPSAPESTGPQPVTAESSSTSDTAESTTDRSETTTSESGSETTGPTVQRVDEGIIALYRFADGQEDEIADLSGVEPLVPLSIVAAEDSPTWTDDGLHFAGGGIAVAMGSSTKIRERLQAASAFTLEVWTTPAEVIQVGPPRLLTLSLDPSERSFSLTHGGMDSPDPKGLPFGDQYGLRLRTALHPDVNGVPTILTQSIAMLAPTHVVATRDVEGLATIWVDGEALISEVRGGDFELWSESHVLAIGNELDLTRGYAGTIHLAAIYERALDAAEIATNRAAGY
jgi:hypothetical protein